MTAPFNLSLKDLLCSLEFRIFGISLTYQTSEVTYRLVVDRFDNCFGTNPELGII